MGSLADLLAAWEKQPAASRPAGINEMLSAVEYRAKQQLLAEATETVTKYNAWEADEAQKRINNPATTLLGERGPPDFAAEVKANSAANTLTAVGIGAAAGTVSAVSLFAAFASSGAAVSLVSTATMGVMGGFSAAGAGAAAGLAAGPAVIITAAVAIGVVRAMQVSDDVKAMTKIEAAQAIVAQGGVTKLDLTDKGQATTFSLACFNFFKVAGF